MDYSKTVNLPSSDFPMKANLPVREPHILQRWEKDNIYQLILKSRERNELYILHDGPPYANGHIHLGHALNKILKDIIIKHKTMTGFQAPYVPGWDCHGLPIELQISKELGDKVKTLPKQQIRKLCREYAQKFIDIQRDEFKRLGVFGDYQNPYLTMSSDYEATIVEIFASLFELGFITKGKKPIYWCPTCVTALAEAEVEYHQHSSPSIFVKFKVDPSSVSFKGVDANNLYVVVWTTTPWTLPANLAVCFHPDFDYSAYKSNDEYFIMADGLAESFTSITGRQLGEKTPLTGEMIRLLKVYHPFIDRESRVIFGNFVTLDQGTGIVHIAPGHGLEDYIAGLEFGLDVFCPVDDEGKFTDEFAPMKGINVFDANPKIIDLLQEKNALIFTNDIEHSYPHCWRCKQPLIFRATAQWFLLIDHNDMRNLALQAIEDTQWIPEWGKLRFKSMVETRPDWCLSRQRSWGVPIPSFYCKQCGKNLMNADTIFYFAKVARERTIEAWYTDEIHSLVPDGFTCECGSDSFEKEYDILDVWFDSGVSHFAVLDARGDLRWPADLYLEGSDQHRGWFQSSLWPALALRQRAPYDTVLTHGFMLDDQGRAMSKSLGNVIPPEDIIDKFGADILRLWVASEDYRNDVRIGYDMIQQIADSYRKIRNTFKFMIGNLSDFTATDCVLYEELSNIDTWILHKVSVLSDQVRQHYEHYEFHLVYRKIVNFCTVDLSALYFDISKDILYVEAKDAKIRRANQTVLYHVIQILLRLIAPILVFTAEEIWQFMGNDGSVHVDSYREPQQEWYNDAVAKTMDILVDIKKDVLKALEIARKDKMIGSSLEADVHLYIPGTSTRELVESIPDSKRFFQVADVYLESEKSSTMADYENSSIAITRSTGKKCSRCWNYSHNIGTHPAHPELCQRCTDIVLKLDR